MPQAILYKGHICTGVKQMHGYRMPQRMEPPFGLWNVR